MKWTRSFPRWASTALLAFGLLNVLSAPFGPKQVMVPAVVVGLIMALFGWKGGLPVIPCVPATLPPGADPIDSGLRVLRRRRRWAYPILFSWLPIGAILLPRLPPSWIVNVFFLVALLVTAPWVVLMYSACPRCGQRFFASNRLGGGPSGSSCAHCGLPLAPRVNSGKP